jgi:hypothetical protein
LNTVAETLAQLTEGYFKTIDLTNQNIFDGSNTDLLSSMIKDGVFLMSTVPTDLDIQAIIFKSMFAILIPFAWGLADDGVFILDPGIACGAALPNDIHITPTGASLTGACVGNKQYYIAGISGTSRSCDSFLCSDNSFALVPGLSSLDGKNWGGVTLNHIITGYVNLSSEMSIEMQKVDVSLAALIRSLPTEIKMVERWRMQATQILCPQSRMQT